MKKSKYIFKLFVPGTLFVLGGIGLYWLWGGQGGNPSYLEMACGFEGRSVDCADSTDDWRRGLAFYDSSLAASGDTLGSLKKLLWNFWNIKFAGAGEAAVSEGSILPLKVLDAKTSGCMGLAWLAMMVAEAREINLSAILLPGHVFLRYGSVNLEPNRQGYSYTDDEYREKYKSGPWTGFEFKPLTSSQFMGLAAFNMGNLYLKDDVHHALIWYRVAEQFFPDYEGIKVNQQVAKNSL